MTVGSASHATQVYSSQAAVQPLYKSPQVKQVAAGQNAAATGQNAAANEALLPISEKTAKNAKIYSSNHRESFFISRAALLKNIAYTRATGTAPKSAPEPASLDTPSAMPAPMQHNPAVKAEAAAPPLAERVALAAELKAEAESAQGTEKTGAMSAAEPSTGCQTCASRVYQDGSGDSGVSYQGAKGMPSSLSGIYVASHEGEHATREAAKAQKEGDIITQKKVTVEMACCPDCGRMYAAGGTTTIEKMEKNEGEGNGVTVQNAVDLLDPAGEQMDLYV